MCLVNGQAREDELCELLGNTVEICTKNCTECIGQGAVGLITEPLQWSTAVAAEHDTVSGDICLVARPIATILWIYPPPWSTPYTGVQEYSIFVYHL